MSIAGIGGGTETRSRLACVPAWLWIGAGTYLLLLLRGNDLLNDPDTLWQIKVGQHILETHALPYTDIYSFTRAGAPWVSSSWLAQVLFAEAHALAGWSGVVVLAAAAVAIAVALFSRLLGRSWPPVYCAFAALIALALSAQHFLARPHVLAMPVMVAWIGGLISASDRRAPPSFWLLPLMVLWVNLHGGFIFGLALVPAIMLDALWNAEAGARRPLALRWAVFGACALAAAFLTPYGWRALAAAKTILDLGALLPLISEWAPPSFAQPGLLEASVLLLIAASLWRGVRLSPPRILLVLGLLHMGLGHVRNIEIFALLTPLVLAAPLARQFGWLGDHSGGMADAARRARTAAVSVAVAVAAGLTWGIASALAFHPRPAALPSAALAVLKERGASLVFNDYPFGGAMIWQGMAPFVDGRAELYGAPFGIEMFDALSLRQPDVLLSLLARYRIDATLLSPETPAAQLMNHLDGWKRIYADDAAVVHVRIADPAGSAPTLR